MEPWAEPYWTFHRCAVEALERLNSQHAVVTREPTSPFFGMTLEQYEKQLVCVRDELDDEVVLALVAAVEAIFRNDLARRIEGKHRRGPLRDSFRQLRDQHGDRIRLDDILEIWKCQIGEVGHGCISRTRQLYKRRHWLAHGRNWTDKSGLAHVDPAGALAILDDLFRRLRGVEPDFPGS